MIDTDLPEEIELSEFVSSPRELRGVYDRSAAGTYRLTPGGQQLRRLKETLGKGPIEYSSWFRAGNSTDVTLADWQKTCAAANANERSALMKLKAAGRIAVKV